MRYLKLFENYKVDKSEYPVFRLSSREKQILNDLVGDYWLNFDIKKDDGYYYTDGYNNRFDDFNDLKDYIRFIHFINEKNINEFLELLKTTKLDMSFDDNLSIRWASENGHKEIVKLLLEDPRVDPGDDDNYAIISTSDKEIFKLLLADPRVDPSDRDNWLIKWASTISDKEIFKLLLADPRVRAKLSSREINIYTNEIS